MAELAATVAAMRTLVLLFMCKFLGRSKTYSLEEPLQHARAQRLLAGVKQRHVRTLQIKLQQQSNIVRAAPVVANRIHAIRIRQHNLPRIFWRAIADPSREA